MIRTIKLVIYSLALISVFSIGYKVVNYKLRLLEDSKLTMSPVTMAVREKQLDCLAKNIYYEAGYEPFEGKVAVAQVTINRSRNDKFPSDICQVVYQKNIVYEKVFCQFSWYCEQASIRKPLNKTAYTESMEVAKKVLLEGFRLNDLKNALYYHADYVHPGWRKTPIAKIGRHIFYE